jgi:hypothetical protein
MDDLEAVEVTLDPEQAASSTNIILVTNKEMMSFPSETSNHRRKVLLDCNERSSPDSVRDRLPTILSRNETPKLPRTSMWGWSSCCAMDDALTPPTPSPSMLRRNSSVALTRNISQLLGSPRGCFPIDDVNDWACQGWQAWSYFQFEQTRRRLEYEVTPKKQDEEWKANMQRILQSRAFDMSTRHARLSDLRRNLNPFEHDTKASPQELAKTVSIQATIQATPGTLSPKKKRNHAKPMLTLSSVWECGTFDCSKPEGSSPALIRKQWEKGCYDNGYDSDPEDYRLARRRRSLTPNNKENEHSLPQMVPVCLDDDQAVHLLVQEFLNETMTLIFHQNTRQGNGSEQRWSFAVQAWVERGQRLQHDIILPRFVWKPLSGRDNKIAHQRSATTGINLLDVFRVMPVQSVDRQVNPFCKIQHSFVIKTNTHTDSKAYVFEASSEQERDRVVQSLKCLIARLAAKLLVEDGTAVTEFFSAPQQQHFQDRQELHWLVSC